MSITKRQEHILELLNENGFLTVTKLSEITYTSPSSIRRDLTHLQSLHFIKRTHGGASVLGEINQPVPLDSRMTQNTVQKRIIAKKAAEFLCDGQSIMLDGSSTAGFMIPHIAKHKDMRVFTNNMITAINAINYGVSTHCIGGESVNQTAVVSGVEAYKTVEQIHTDILFFSSQSLDKNGIISDPIPEENYIRTLMIKNSDIKVFLCDSEKFGRQSLYTLTSIDNIDACVFDEEWPDLKAKCRIL